MSPLNNETKVVIGKEKISSDDATWILTSSFIIFTMQSGFSLLESGCVTRRNEVNVMMKNVVDVVFGGTAYWMFGYSLSFGEEKGTNPIFGVGSYFVEATELQMGYVFAAFLFQLSFATTATTIVSGAMAERCNFTAYCLFSFFNVVIFCLPANWIWSNQGFLGQMHVVDIAGCASVHLVGGISALIAAIMLKPRLGRYDDGDKCPDMSCPTNVIVGMFMLWWGWLGFNCGSTFGVSGNKWKYTARSAMVTILTSVGGGITSLIFSYIFKKRKFVIINFVNGILSSLVAITAGCALYHPKEALLIGALSSLMSNACMPLIDRLRVDDPVGAISVHVVGSLWGMIAVGLFVEKDTLLKLSKGESGLFYGGGFYLLGVQVLATVVIGCWSAVTTFLLLYGINKLVPIRMSEEDELAGADFVEHGITYELEDTQSTIGSLVNLLENGNKPDSTQNVGAKRFFEDPRFSEERLHFSKGLGAITFLFKRKN